jgi:hypothetical protein
LKRSKFRWSRLLSRPEDTAPTYWRFKSILRTRLLWLLAMGGGALAGASLGALIGVLRGEIEAWTLSLAFVGLFAGLGAGYFAGWYKLIENPVIPRRHNSHEARGPDE